MLAGWKYYKGKKVWIILRNKKIYQGIVLEVDADTSKIITWLTIVDKFNKRVTFSVDEIDVIKEEELV